MIKSAFLSFYLIIGTIPFQRLDAFEILLNKTVKVTNGKLCLRDLGSIEGADEKTQSRWISKCHVAIDPEAKYLEKKDLEILFWQNSFAADKISDQRVALRHFKENFQHNHMSSNAEKSSGALPSVALVRKGDVIKVVFKKGVFEFSRLMRAESTARVGQTILTSASNGKKLKVRITESGEGELP